MVDRRQEEGASWLSGSVRDDDDKEEKHETLRLRDLQAAIIVKRCLQRVERGRLLRE
ncbi:hypothetical protein K0M31_010417 [Melipona bicolor]|uniref:Uncharacterized protein n=1 Tax=Melipona bicolor TaxID=60889 RepID=A0AA40KIK4_9HYME|nr:hypothetical protein K0M31_010417 [Melipona bicolor]